MTNFKHFVILACKNTVKIPREAEIARVDLLHANDADLKFLLYFAKENWFAEEGKKELYARLGEHKTRIPVSEQLLDDMKRWRELLLTGVRKYKSFAEDEMQQMEEQIQNFIDRLIFICYCEDKELEEPQLRECLYEKKGRFVLRPGYLLEKIRTLFEKYHQIYNSELFDKGDCDRLRIDDDKIICVLEGLREPKDKLPYDFRSIEADILGKVYENFLGHLTRGKKRFKEKEDIGKRKKEGIYYTPKYIVDYIVNNTVREYVKEKSFEEILKVKVLDPACGSGSFLLRAYEVLVEEAEKKKKLSYYEKKQLMLSCIYGVDLDNRARAIAILNLSLKLAERGQKLPRLNENLKRGNSLIDDKTVAGWDAFVWEDEFKEIMNTGGFDVVIGNPPYVFARNQKFSNEEKKYYYKNYKLQKYQLNTYCLFVEKAYNILKFHGIFGFIIPNNWLTIQTFSDFRNFILHTCAEIKILNIYDKVFEEANVDTCILTFKKEKPNRINLYEMRETVYKEIGSFRYNYFEKNNNVLNIPLLKNKVNLDTLQKIENNSLMLERISSVSTGLKAYQVGKGIPKQTETIKKEREFHSKDKRTSAYLPYLGGRDVGRYNLSWSGEYLKYGEHLAEPRRSVPFKGTRILVRQIPSKPPYCINSVIVDKEILHDINSMVIFNVINQYNLKYVLGIINSKLISYWFFNKFGKLQRKLFPQFKVKELKLFPIIKIKNKYSEEELIRLVDRMLSLNKQLNETKNEEERKRIQKEIERTDREIDELVYKLYGITEEGKKIIEECLK